MRKLRWVGVFLAVDLMITAAGFTSAVKAGLDMQATIPAKPETMELVVMEAPGCTYCTIFRRDVLPSYEASERAKEMPIRFVDINDDSAQALGLDGPIDVVPTFVVLRNNKEVGRIPGYMGPEFFYHSIYSLVSGG